ncbi:MAG: hypothetical protein RLZZ508_234 [Actinomycetota bacterium]|jgi:hypothetical protein
MNNKKKITWLATGVATIAANSLNPMLVGPASAANVPLPTCDATQTDEAINSTLTTYNTAAINTYKGGAKYKQLVAAVKNAEKALKKAKGKSKTAAQKNLNKAKAKRDAALAAATSGATVSQFKATVTGDFVDVDRTWGDYSTRIFVKAGKVVDLCYNIDESMHTEEDRTTSQNDYIALVNPDAIVDALMPNANGRTVTQINNAYGTYVEDLMASYDVLDYSWATDLGAMTGATYTVKTFYDSIQAVLIEANLVNP